MASFYHELFNAFTVYVFGKCLGIVFSFLSYPRSSLYLSTSHSNSHHSPQNNNGKIILWFAVISSTGEIPSNWNAHSISRPSVTLREKKPWSLIIVGSTLVLESVIFSGALARKKNSVMLIDEAYFPSELAGGYITSNLEARAYYFTCIRCKILVKTHPQMVFLSWLTNFQQIILI